MAEQRLNHPERQQRNDMIVAMRARGVSERQVAQTLNVDRTTVQRVMKEFRAMNPTLRNADPLEIIDEMLGGLQADLEELATLSVTAKSDNARVGAINARMAARDRIISLLQTTGVLPHDLGKLSVEIDVRYIAARVVAVLGKHNVDEAVQRDLLDALRGASQSEN